MSWFIDCSLISAGIKMKFLSCFKIVDPRLKLILAVDWVFGERPRLSERYGLMLKVSQREGWVSGFSKLHIIFMFSCR